MFSWILNWLKETYVENGRFRGALLEDVILMASMALGIQRVTALDWKPDGGFFNGDLTRITLLLVATVMFAYHVLWRILETRTAMQKEMSRESLKEQFPRFMAALFLLIGLYNFSKDVPLFILSLVMFYLSLNIWHWTLSKNMRKVRGTIVFDIFGLFCAIAFAYFAYDLYLKSQVFYAVTLPRFAKDPQSASVVRDVFGGRQTNSVYAMGLFAGAMAANAFLALFSGNRRQSVTDPSISGSLHT